MTINELRQKRAGLIAQARSIIDTADAASRALLQEEETRYNALMAEVNQIGTDIDRREQLEALEAHNTQPAGGSLRPEPNGAGQGAQPMQFQSRGLQYLNDATPDWQTDPLWQPILATSRQDYRGRFQRTLRSWGNEAEQRALQADSDVLGGSLLAPIQMVDRLLAAVDNVVFLRQLATVIAVPNADSLGAVSLDNDPADPTWTSELAIGTEDLTMSFGKRELHPHPLAKYIKISRKLLTKVPSVEGLVNNRLTYKFGVTGENNYLNGSGAGQPLGVFTASASGVSTARDVSTGNAQTSMTFDGLTEAKYTLKGQYWARARWMFHRDGVKQLAKLKNGDGQYIWRESVRAGEPDVLLNLPVMMSEYAPNTFAAGLYVGMLADWSYYWIADSLSMEFQRLVELFAATNQIGIVGRLESDGMPVLAEAFVRVKLAP